MKLSSSSSFSYSSFLCPNNVFHTQGGGSGGQKKSFLVLFTLIYTRWESFARSFSLDNGKEKSFTFPVFILEDEKEASCE